MRYQDRVTTRRNNARRARVVAATATQDVALPALASLILLGLAYYLASLIS